MRKFMLIGALLAAAATAVSFAAPTDSMPLGGAEDFRVFSLGDARGLRGETGAVAVYGTLEPGVGGLRCVRGQGEGPDLVVGAAVQNDTPVRAQSMLVNDFCAILHRERKLLEGDLSRSDLISYFSSAQTRLKRANKDLMELEANGEILWPGKAGEPLRFVGTDAARNVFALSWEQYASLAPYGSYPWRVETPEGSLALINIVGEGEIDFKHGGVRLAGKARLLLNFDPKFYHIEFGQQLPGSLLAPDAFVLMECEGETLTVGTLVAGQLEVAEIELNYGDVG